MSEGYTSMERLHSNGQLHWASYQPMATGDDGRLPLP